MGMPALAGRMFACRADGGCRAGGTPQGGDGIGPVTVILIAVILAVAIGIWMARGDSLPSSLLGDRSAADRLSLQVSLVRTALDSCSQQYPGGSNGIGGRPAFPGGSGVPLDGLLCPGAPAARQALWGGSFGTTLPPAVPGYAWTYTNDGSGVRLTATAMRTGQVAALQRVERELGTAQTSVNTAARTLTVWVAR